ncbi:hypothetical protein ACFY5F_29280 [Streptomyces sp. NPDC013161]|uniref:hypothetical protein n=1 Tax=Streptomyces sp. NPDC013161 TaxID=3364862 RepID=UPI0036B60EC0
MAARRGLRLRAPRGRGERVEAAVAALAAGWLLARPAAAAWRAAGRGWLPWFAVPAAVLAAGAAVIGARRALRTVRALRDLLIRDGWTARRVGGRGDPGRRRHRAGPAAGRGRRAGQTHRSRLGRDVRVKGTVGPVHGAQMAVVVADGSFTGDARAGGGCHHVYWIGRDGLRGWAGQGVLLRELLGLPRRPARRAAMGGVWAGGREEGSHAACRAAPRGRARVACAPLERVYAGRMPGGLLGGVGMLRCACRCGGRRLPTMPVTCVKGTSCVILLYAFCDQDGVWHGDRDAVIDQSGPSSGTLTLAAGPPREAGVFAGQTLTVLFAACDLEASQSSYRLDDGRCVPASWHVHELLAPAYEPDTGASRVSPGGVAAPGVRFEVTHGGRRYCLAADPAGSGRLEVTVLVCSTDGIIHGELTGEMDAGDLAGIGRLITAMAGACLTPSDPAPAADALIGTMAPGVKASRPGAAWTPAAEQHLRQGHRAGKTAAELAGELGRTENAIRWKLFGFKLAPYPADLVPVQRAAPATEPAPPKAYTVADRRHSHPRAYERWTPQEDARLGELHARSMPVGEMARELGRNEGAIRARLERILPPF